MIKPKSLYIHIPFCLYICDYCDFAKLQYFSSYIEPYLNGLKNELKQYQIGMLDTIYVGGGTPTSLSNIELEKLLKIIQPYSDGIKEYTFEANPDSLTKDKLISLKRYGVNRLSVGVESTNDKILKSINRHHTFDDVIKLNSFAKSLNFNNINYDLILGLPNVNKDMLVKDINNVLSLNPTHISCYSLTVNEHTRFAINRVKQPDDDCLRELYDLVNDMLTKAGYVHYEVSNWCKPGYESLHNFCYWKNDQYYGCGLGAAGYIDNIRYSNTRSINKYNEGKFLLEKEELSLRDKMNYQIMLNLRTNKGLDLDEFLNKYHIDLLKEKYNEINNLLEYKLITLENRKIVATYEGMMLLDSVITKLIF